MGCANSKSQYKQKIRKRNLTVNSSLNIQYEYFLIAKTALKDINHQKIVQRLYLNYAQRKILTLSLKNSYNYNMELLKVNDMIKNRASNLSSSFSKNNSKKCTSNFKSSQVFIKEIKSIVVLKKTDTLQSIELNLKKQNFQIFRSAKNKFHRYHHGKKIIISINQFHEMQNSMAFLIQKFRKQVEVNGVVINSGYSATYGGPFNYEKMVRDNKNIGMDRWEINKFIDKDNLKSCGNYICDNCYEYVGIYNQYIYDEFMISQFKKLLWEYHNQNNNIK